MRYRSNKIRVSTGLSLVEMIIALAIMVIVFAAIVPQFRAIRNSLDSKAGAAEALQNGRVLIDHLSRNLSKAVRITAVSEPNETDGYIEFQDDDGNNLRYDIAANNYVEFGPVGSLSDLAGPVSQLQFTCYDANDLDTPITNVGDIRYVKVQATLTNAAPLGQDKTFTAWAYLRTNSNGLVAWWKLDETSGLTAADSSGNGNDGTLINMTGNEWTTGMVDGALAFDGDNDAITGIGDCPTGNFTVAGWAKDTGGGGWKVFYSAEQEIWFGVDSGATPAIWLDCGGNGNGAQTAAGTWTLNTWHHIAATWDGTTVHIYLDGVDMGITTFGTPENPLAVAAVIGAWSGNPNDENWFGTLDDVRLYNRALSADEIAALAVKGGFVGWWKLDESSGTNASDSSGNGNDGTLTNMAGDEWTDGAVDGALEFDGADDYVQTTSNESKTSTDFTWACWFKADTTIGAHHLIWQGKATENGWGAGASGHHEAHINIGAYDTDNILGCFYGTNEDAAAPGVIRIDTSFSDTTNWHHVAFLVTDADSSPSGELFLDGVSVGTDTGNQTGRTDWDTNLRIGRPGANDRYFDGTIDDVRVYNRALSADEITRLTTAGGVEFLTAWTSGLSHTAQTGSNRLLIFTAHCEDDDTDMNLSSVTYGGQSMTKVIERNVETGYRAYVVAYILDEAGIDAASSDTFVVTWAQTPSRTPGYSSVFLQNVDQTNPTGASASNSTTSSSTLTTSALSTNDGDMVIVTGTCGNEGTYSVNNGFIESIELTMTSADGVAGYKKATGSDETPSITHDNVNRQVIIGFVVQATEDQSGGLSQTGSGEEIRP